MKKFIILFLTIYFLIGQTVYSKSLISKDVTKEYMNMSFWDKFQDPVLSAHFSTIY